MCAFYTYSNYQCIPMLSQKSTLIQPKKPGKKTCYGHRRLGSTASTVSGDDIKLVWANNKGMGLLKFFIPLT